MTFCNDTNAKSYRRAAGAIQTFALRLGGAKRAIGKRRESGTTRHLIVQAATVVEKKDRIVSVFPSRTAMFALTKSGILLEHDTRRGGATISVQMLALRMSRACGKVLFAAILRQRVNEELEKDCAFFALMPSKCRDVYAPKRHHRPAEWREAEQIAMVCVRLLVCWLVSQSKSSKSAYRGATVSIQSNAVGMCITRIPNIVAAIQKDEIIRGATITFQVGTLGVVGTLFLVVFGKGQVLGVLIVEATVQKDARLGGATIVFQVRTKRMRRARGPRTFATYIKRMGERNSELIALYKAKRDNHVCGALTIQKDTFGLNKKSTRKQSVSR